MLVVTKAQITLSEVLNAFTKCVIFLMVPKAQTDTEIMSLFVILVHSYCSRGLSLLFRNLPSYKNSTLLI